MIPDKSAAYERKYETNAIIISKSVSVMAEWVRNLNHLNVKLLKIPKNSPIPIDVAASAKKLPKISNGDLTVKLKLVLNP